MSKMEIELNLGYEVKHDDPQVEQIGMDIMADEIQAFVRRVQDRLEAEGVEIKQMSQTNS